MAKARQPDSTRPTPPDTDPGLSVVMPAYNEAGNLLPLVRECVDALADTGRAYEIVIVDDGSTDATAERLTHLAELYEQVVAIHLARNFGQSAALQAGIDAAGGDVIVTLDADGQNDPADIPRLLARLDSAGVACVSGRRAERHDPLTKRIPSAIQTRLAERTCPGVHDFGCTLKAYDADALADIQLRGEGHRYIPAKVYAKGYGVDEVDVNHRPRENGESHYGTARLVRGFVDLLFAWFIHSYGARPMHLFGGVGSVCLAIGAAVGVVSVVQKYAFGVALAPHLPRLVLVALLILFGVQLLIFGVLAELIQRLHYRDEQPYRIRSIVGQDNEHRTAD